MEKQSANCWCDLEDEYERYEALFSLIQVKGRWFVDVPDEDAALEYEEIEDIVEEIIERGITN